MTKARSQRPEVERWEPNSFRLRRNSTFLATVRLRDWDVSPLRDFIRGGSRNSYKASSNSQPCPRLPKAGQACPSHSPGEGGGAVVGLKMFQDWPVKTSQSGVKLRQAVFRKKKIVYFSRRAKACLCWRSGTESIQINSFMSKSVPKADQSRPKNEINY